MLANFEPRTSLCRSKNEKVLRASGSTSETEKSLKASRSKAGLFPILSEVLVRVFETPEPQVLLWS